MARPQSLSLPAFLGVDVGGTFTDFAWLEDGRLRIHKVPSTTHDQSQAVLAGIREMGLEREFRLVHGTTVATNAVLERRGARTALITTRGCRDVLEIGRQTRQVLYTLTPSRPEPLVPRELRFEVDERLDWQGEAILPLSQEQVRPLSEELRKRQVEALAVCFLFSFLNAAHEQQALAALKGGQWFACASHQVLPEYREYERTSATVLNAYISPVLSKYLRQLEKRLGGTRCEGARAMQSNGGAMSLAEARQSAIHTLFSGPAGGVVGAMAVAKAAGQSRIPTFDMGGTSTDVCLCDGVPSSTSQASIAGLPLGVPTLAIDSVGAGGGSIARLDVAGALRVGPESAGADPGPACYGRGDRLTVTDAHLVLGHLLPEAFLGGRMPLDVERARRLMAQLASQWGLGTEELAHGILQVADAQMARALRRVSAERGYDPREFTLVAFGGCGPLHTCALAEALGITRVLVPRYPGILSALGLALSDVAREYAQTVLWREPSAWPRAETAFAALEARAAADLGAEGVLRESWEFSRMVGMRYQGQSYEILIAAEAGSTAEWVERFHLAHQRTYGHHNPRGAVEVVNLRLRASAPTGAAWAPHEHSDVGAKATSDRLVPIWSGGWKHVPVYEREMLRPGASLSGPTLVVQEDSTVLIPQGWQAEVDAFLNLRLVRVEERAW